MKTQHTVTIRFQDGRSLLDTWSQEFESMPTIGESLSVDIARDPGLKGYKDRAMVSRVDVGLAGQDPVVVLEAVPLVGESHRTVVVLNANYISEPLRGKVEKLIRSRLTTPVFEWVAGCETRPVIGIHGPAQNEATRVNEEVRMAISKSSSLAAVG